MRPTETGYRYDKIASWWNGQQDKSTAGLRYVRRAARLASNKGKALDVGCGSGGRVINALAQSGFEITGIDVSESMVRLARENHPGSRFVFGDICDWQPREEYDVIVAWDSTFHVPHFMQREVVEKLCGALASNGVILFTAGGVDSEITGRMGGQEFYYSSLEEVEYLRILKGAGCQCILLERDAFPEEHVVFMGTKRRPEALSDADNRRRSTL
ncbi:MAG TPA: class I SAM-dependent methyltransferase [Rubrobacteraceae bacterium]|nr:class I SAM-dependent methyltransferase [Rubrobacteraceae bacterium]